MTKDFECIYCDAKFPVEIQTNFSVICPYCKRSIHLECEYGYGPVTPCQIYLGEELAGIVESDKANYYLNINFQKTALNKTYLEAIYEAEDVIKKQLKIFRHNVNLQILTRGGSLCFYGDWFGRPYKYHKIVSTYYDGEILEIKFDLWERLLVYEPENITSTKQELKIAKAKKLKWIYVPYNSDTNEYTTITYTAECDNLYKQTKSQTEHLMIREPFLAVYIG